MVYAELRHGAPFRVFAKAHSKAYFDKMKCLLGIQSKEELDPLFEAFRDEKLHIPKWQFDTFSPAALSGFRSLATKP